MLIRVSLYGLLNDPGSLQIITISDILAWGLILNICIFNERERLLNYNPKISSVSTTISVALIVIFSLLFVFGIINEVSFIFDPNRLLWVGGFFSITSLITCIIYMINSNPSQEEDNNSKEVH
jgi:hypothetical protein